MEGGNLWFLNSLEFRIWHSLHNDEGKDVLSIICYKVTSDIIVKRPGWRLAQGLISHTFNYLLRLEIKGVWWHLTTHTHTPIHTHPYLYFLRCLYVFSIIYHQKESKIFKEKLETKRNWEIVTWKYLHKILLISDI